MTGTTNAARMDGITERSEGPSVRERLGDMICGFQTQVFYLFVIQVVLLVLLLLSVVYIEPGTASYAVLQLDFIALVVTLTPTVLILYACGRREAY